MSNIKTGEPKHDFKRYVNYAKPYWIYFLLAPLCKITEVVCDIHLPLLAAEIVNLGVSQGDVMLIQDLAMTMMRLVVLSWLGGVGACFFAAKASVQFACDLREDMFRKIQQFSFANIDTFSTGSLITRLTNDISQLQDAVVTALRMAIRAPGILIGALIMSFRLNPQLSIVFLVIIPLLIWIMGIILRLSYKKFGYMQHKVDGLNGAVREALINVRVIKSLAREDFEGEKFQTVNDDLKQTALSAYLVTIIQMPLMTFVVNLATIALVWIVGNGSLHGDIEIGDLTAIITYLTQILVALNALANIFMKASRALASAKRVSEVLDTEIDLTDEGCKEPQARVEHGDIEFRDVTFKYYKDKEEKILKNINLHMKAGETVGIVGSTGSGKTSLVSLIPRLYDVVEGAVLVDGVDVREYSLGNLREGVAVVLQNNVLFSGSIQENLRWGDSESTAEQHEQAAQWAAAHDFIQGLPDQYHTILGQGGVNLSGGQKQRVCIARALLKNPKILVLDDSTSAVDTDTERTIRDHLLQELTHATKIIIAQRISSVQDADMIVVLNEGVVEATGTHQYLLEHCLTYQEIYESQVKQEVPQ